ncbi:CoA transferase [Frankia sp. CN7]|nr:CoA transferase [Frankia nepalensis]
MVRASDGWLAVNLARIDDVDLLPAWLERDDLAPADDDHADENRPAEARPVTERSGPGPRAGDPRPAGGPGPAGDGGQPASRAIGTVRPWSAIAAAVADRAAAALVERAELLGLPVALVVDPARAAADEQALARGQRFPFAPFLVDGRPPDAVTGRGEAGAQRGPRDGFTVVDLSSLWAGPLCAHLLGLAGGRVVKVEGAGRLDGARQGPAAFYDLLHAGHASVVVDLRSAGGRAELVRLIQRADVVLEASRPRALDQLGIDPAAMIARNPRLTWVSITGHGRTGPWRQRPAFGDDAAAAAGAVAVDAAGRPVFLADAVADPVTGVLAAAAALASLLAGGGHHVDIALREAVGSLLAGRPALPERDPTARPALRGQPPLAVAAPRMRVPAAQAFPPGHDNARLLAGPAAGGSSC